MDTLRQCYLGFYYLGGGGGLRCWRIEKKGNFVTRYEIPNEGFQNKTTALVKMDTLRQVVDKMYGHK